MVRGLIDSGTGVRIVDDIDMSDPHEPQLGGLAAYVRDRRIPLELCPSSNVQTGAAASIAEHPIGLLRRLNFRVTLNTDNRLMSGTSMSREMELCCEAFGVELERSAVADSECHEERLYPFQ